MRTVSAARWTPRDKSSHGSCARTLCHHRSARRRLSLRVIYPIATALRRVRTGRATLGRRGMQLQILGVAFLKPTRQDLCRSRYACSTAKPTSATTARLAALMDNPNVAKVLEPSTQRNAEMAKRQQEWIAAQGRP